MLRVETFKKMFVKNTTRFHNLSPLSSILLIAMLILTIAYGLIVCKPLIPNNVSRSTAVSDSDYYRSILERIRAGEGYYAAAGDELRRRGYATSSVFNWRLPVLALLLGHLPGMDTGRVLALILALITLLIWMTVFHKYQYSFGQVMAGGLLLAGPVIYGLSSEPCLYHEFWAGILIALSLAAYGKGWRSVSVICGLTALLLRELTLPFVCVMMALAYMEGRRREALVWFVGIIAFGGELFFHWSIVRNLITEKDLAHPHGWIVFSGWPFVLHTTQMHPYLLIAPSWVTAIILPPALFGLAGWRGKLGTRVACTVGIYILAYFFVGLPFNQYWGLMYVFIMPLGLLHAPRVLRDLWQIIRRKMMKGLKEN